MGFAASECGDSSVAAAKNAASQCNATRPIEWPAPHPAQTHSHSRGDPGPPTSRARCSGPPRGHGHTRGGTATSSRSSPMNSAAASVTNTHTAQHSGHTHSESSRPTTCRARAMTAWRRATRQRRQRMFAGVASTEFSWDTSRNRAPPICVAEMEAEQYSARRADVEQTNPDYAATGRHGGTEWLKTVVGLTKWMSVHAVVQARRGFVVREAVR